MTEEIPIEHFAQLDENNTVVNVINVGQNVLVDEQGNPLSFPESEPVGQKFLESVLGPGVWKQTSYADPPAYRKNTAGIGGKYDPVNDEFYTPVEPAVEPDSDIQPSQLF